MNINFHKIKTVKGLTEEQLENMTIKELKALELEITNAEVTERRADPVALERYQKFFRAYNDFVDMFGKELTDKYLVTVSFSELVTTEHYLQEPMYMNPREFVRKGSFLFKEYKGDYVREVYKSGEEWLIPSQYQGLRHADIIKQIVAEKWTWLNDNFKYDCYEIRGTGNNIDEFYLKTSLTSGHNSLYVPWKAFVRRDINAILERNKKYLKGYTHSDKAYEALVETPEVKKFLEYLK